MAKCDLTIEFDTPRERYHPGDEVSGHVVVQTDDSVRCDGLVAELLWKTHGRGNSTSGDAETVELFQGEWVGSTHMRYAFRFTLPAGPVTYNGHYLNVGWFVRARADIPWKIDPKAEAEVVLVSGEGEGRGADWQRQFTSGYHEDLATVVAEAQKSSTELGGRSETKVRLSLADARAEMFSSPGKSAASCGCLGLILAVPLIFLGMFSMAAWDGVDKARAGDWGGAVPGLIMGGIVVLVILLVVIGLVRQSMLKSRFGTIEFALEPDRVDPGTPAQIRVSFTPRKDSELEKGTLRIEGVERVVSGSGTNKSTRRHVVHEEEIEFCGARRLMNRQPVILEGEIPVPETAPPSFDAPDNELEWKVSARLHIARFPDWHGSRRLVVHPVTFRG